MAKDGDKKNQDLVKAEVRSGTWTPVPYLQPLEHVFSLKVVVGELAARFPLCISKAAFCSKRCVGVYQSVNNAQCLGCPRQRATVAVGPAAEWWRSLCSGRWGDAGPSCSSSETRVKRVSASGAGAG